MLWYIVHNLMICRYSLAGKQNSMIDLQRRQNTDNYLPSESMTDLSSLPAFESSDSLNSHSPWERSCGVEFWSTWLWRLTESTYFLNKPPTPSVNLLKSVGAGGLWAITGPSGSGKTTLLCALSLRLDLNRMTLSGEIRMNGKPYGTRLLKGMSGFVMPRWSASCPSLFRRCSGTQQLCQSGWWLCSNPVEHVMDVIAKR